MAYIVYSSIDPVSSRLADAVKKISGFEPADNIEKFNHFVSNNTDMIEIDTYPFQADFLDSLVKTDLFVMLSRHVSSKQIGAFTTHSTGNWSNEAKYGGKGKELSVASPIDMLNVLKSIKKFNSSGISFSYEATHHGPLLKTPSMFVELGGNEEVMNNDELANTLAQSVVTALQDQEPEYDKIVVGIGGTHYPEKFTSLALQGKYAFAHIMSRHNVENVDMLEKAFKCSSPNPELAVIEWKSIKAGDRDRVIKALESLGLDHERV